MELLESTIVEIRLKPAWSGCGKSIRLDSEGSSPEAREPRIDVCQVSVKMISSKRNDSDFPLSPSFHYIPSTVSMEKSGSGIFEVALRSRRSI